MEQRMIITVGIPGCGKSTWAKQLVKDNPEFVQSERDILRASRLYTPSGNLWDYKFSRGKENDITARQEDQIRLALTSGRSVVVSDTNINEGTRHRLTRIATGYDITPEFEVFDVPFHQALKWNAKRSNSVPESVMIRMERNMREYMGKYVQTDKVREKHEKALTRSCVIMDIDGTLANMRGIRGPFEWDRVGEDKVIEHVADYAAFLYNNERHDLILFSGRDGSCREQTEEWLLNHAVPYKELHMRPEGSTINDSILKEQMYMDVLHDRYLVDHVVDDRKQVCMMWESMGFRVMNVGGFLADF